MSTNLIRGNLTMEALKDRSDEVALEQTVEATEASESTARPMGMAAVEAASQEEIDEVFARITDEYGQTAINRFNSSI